MFTTLLCLRCSFFSLIADSYDVLAISGGMGEGHIRCVALPEMARIVKPGRSEEILLSYFCKSVSVFPAL